MPLIRISQLKLPLGYKPDDVERKIRSILGIQQGSIISWKIVRKSIDAREKTAIRIILAVSVKLNDKIHGGGEGREWDYESMEAGYVFPSNGPRAYVQKSEPLGTMARPAETKAPKQPRPVIVGAGPAGLFCALLLAEQGYRPLVLERGRDVDSRMRDVKAFWETGELSPESNMQFGEGGAGTFSDGKLNTSVGDKDHLGAKIIQEFIEAGAPSEIALSNKPHIGTDNLVTIVKNIRKKIEKLGGEIRFDSRVTSLGISDGRIRSVIVSGTEEIDADILVLAIGHSARDTFEMLSSGPVSMIQKPFAVGVRIEHPQEMIQKSQYGSFWKHPDLPAADYKLTFQSSAERGVYSFCMCPGGFVVNSSSEPGMVACNGMSNFARNERNANSAIVVTVRTEDFGSSDVLAGIEFQRRWERAAFLAAGSFAMPIQLFGDFLAKKVSSAFGGVTPCAKGRVEFADLNSCLPPFVIDALKEGIPAFDKKIRGFSRADAILTGIETRTSSPVRIVRDAGLQSSVAGIFPCGEGGGHSGGIMSSAMDGIRVAEAVVLLCDG
jgi:uncharacterized FAD-dependent dehydrogenase